MIPQECKKSATNATKLSSVQKMLVIAWFSISQWWRTRKGKPAYGYSLCCLTAGPAYHRRVGWAQDDLAVAGGEHYLTERVLVRWLMLWLSLAGHETAKHILLLFQHAQVTFLRGGCCLGHACACLM